MSQENQNEPRPFDSIDLLGIVKRIHKELEDLPIHTHTAVTNALNLLAQHRMGNMQAENLLKQRQQQLEAQFAPFRQPPAPIVEQ